MQKYKFKVGDIVRVKRGVMDYNLINVKTKVGKIIDRCKIKALYFPDTYEILYIIEFEDKQINEEYKDYWIEEGDIGLVKIK